MAVRTAGSPPQPHLLLPRGVWTAGLPQGSGWIGRWSSHALPHARRPRITGPQGADTELVRSEMRHLAAAKMLLTSARGHFRLLRRWQWPARRQCSAGGGVSRSGRPRLGGELRGAHEMSPGRGANPSASSSRAERAARPGPLVSPWGGGLAEANTSNLHTSTSPTPCGPCCDD